MNQNTTEGQGTDMIYGYMGKILRVDLSSKQITSESFDKEVLRKFLGGATLGIKYLCDEVNPEIKWSDPDNRIFFGGGPLSGTRVSGSGTTAVVTKGALTNGLASTQANGNFLAFLRKSGFDALIIQGAASEWSYLYIHDGRIELRDAGHLVGKDNIEVDRLIKEELNKEDNKVSVLSIGPAGENLVKFSCVFIDFGHVAGHNGTGAVMGSKKLKAIVVDRGKEDIPIKDKDTFAEQAKQLLANIYASNFGAMTFREGTVGGVVMSTKMNIVPVKNYTSNIHEIAPDKLDQYAWDKIRDKFKAKRSACWGCPAHHCHTMKITEGKYAGRIFEEPEYEGMAACSAAIGVDDVTTSVVLASEIDRLGLEMNESGWVMAFTMECYEKGILSKEDLDGLEMNWGNGEAAMALLNNIAHRRGFGNVLAEGVMRASKKIGGEAGKMAIYTQKGNTPRGHDHRVMWLEMFDTCVSSLGTLETHRDAPYEKLGLAPNFDPFDPMMVSTVEAKIKGAMIFEDSLVGCRFNTASQTDLLCGLVNSATGWDMDFDEAMTIGKRAANMARVFNLRAGIGPELDTPSERYGSTPVDGPAAGKGIMKHWNDMLQNYYNLMGWDEEGRPLQKTLEKLGI